MSVRSKQPYLERLRQIDVVTGHHTSKISSTFHVGGYVGATPHRMKLGASASHAWHTIETERTVSVSLLQDHSAAKYAARSTQLVADASLPLEGLAFDPTPFIRIEHVRLQTSDFSESGGPSALTAEGADLTLTAATVGVRGEHTFCIGNTLANGHIVVGWRAVPRGQSPQMNLSTDEGTPFTVTGVPTAKQGLIIHAGLGAQFSAVNVQAEYRYQGGTAAEHHASIGLSIAF